MSTKTTRFDPMQAMMRRRQADASREQTPASDYDRLLAEFRQLQEMFEAQQRVLSTLEENPGADAVTGLASAHILAKELERSLATARRYGRRHALIILSVDDFDNLSQQLGQERSQAILQHVARLLRQNIRPTDIAAHHQTGEFGIILNELRAIENATMRANELVSIISQTPCIVGGSSLHTTVTCGFHVFGQDDEARDIIAKARAEMQASTPETPVS
jgi:diguanylate cyclase (GGDEF)-like protein